MHPEAYELISMVALVSLGYMHVAKQLAPEFMEQIVWHPIRY
jgi:hypothetical protein